MPDPKRQRIIVAAEGRLRAILVRDGFNTNVGRHVFVNATPALGPDDAPDAVAMMINDDQPGHQAEKIYIELPIEFQAIARADLDRPWITVEQILGDIKRALELADRTLGGLVLRQFERGTTRTLEREDGSPTVGAGVLYTFPYTELWGTP